MKKPGSIIQFQDPTVDPWLVKKNMRTKNRHIKFIHIFWTKSHHKPLHISAQFTLGRVITDLFCVNADLSNKAVDNYVSEL